MLLKGSQEVVAGPAVVEKVVLGKRKREEEEVSSAEESSEESSSESESEDGVGNESESMSESESESDDHNEGEGKLYEAEEDEEEEEEEEEEDDEDVVTEQKSEDENTDTANADASSSSASDSDSGSESESESESESGSEPVSESQEETDSDSDSESETSTSSSENEASDSSTSFTSSTSSSSSEESTTLERPTASPAKHAISKPDVPPGQGSARTHLRNRRRMRVKQLKRLIAEGILRKGSTLADLDMYEQEGTRNYISPQREVETAEAPEIVAEEEMHELDENKGDELEEEGQQEEEETEVKIEEKEPVKALPRKVDVAAVSRFIKAGLVGNEGYDRARQEARLRGKDKEIIPSDFEIVRERPLLPRKVSAKKQKTTDAPIPDIRELESRDPEEQEITDEETEEVDPLTVGFYKQIELAAHARQSRIGKSSTTPVPAAIAPTKAPDKKKVPENVIIRAFECEPEWCGMVEAQEGEEVDSIEIDPPSLPFIDNYPRSKRSKSTANAPSTTPASTSLLALQPQIHLPLSETEILALPKIDSPSVGTQIFFKSLFLHPQRFEPAILWRWGRVTGTENQAVRIEIIAPTFKDEDNQMEEGEIETLEEVLSWPELRDVRLYIGA